MAEQHLNSTSDSPHKEQDTAVNRQGGDQNHLPGSGSHVEGSGTAGVTNKDSESELSGDETSSEEDIDSEDFSGESSGYESPSPPTPCECGYISYGSDYDSGEDDESDDYDDYGSYCSRLSKLEDGRLSRSYRHHVTCKAKPPFPFEKLPPEVRSMIFRLLMPDDRTQPLHSREHDWNDKYDCYYTDDFAMLEYEAPAEDIPTSLFRVDKRTSAEALRLFHIETYFRMDVTPFGIRARGGVTREVNSFSNHEVLAKWKAFQCMHNYHLNIKSSSVRETFDPRGMDIVRDPRTYEDGAGRIKEWLRLVCDELVKNDIIQNLTITAPCKCAQKAARRVPIAESTIFDLFAPLKRIRLRGSIFASLHDDRKKKKGMQHPCRKPACLSLARTLQASIGRLQGEPLSEREATWKAIKSLKHQDDEKDEGGRMNGYFWDHWTHSGIEDVWECLSGRGLRWYGDDEQLTFEDAVQHFHTQRAEAEVKRLEWKKKYEEEQETKQQAEQKNDSQGGKQDERQMLFKAASGNEGTSLQQTAQLDDHQQENRDDESAE